MSRKVHAQIIHTYKVDDVHYKVAAVIESILRNGGRIEGATTFGGLDPALGAYALRTTVYWSEEV